MQTNQLTQKQQAQNNLGIIKQALDAAVKGSVFENMDVAFSVANAFNDIAKIVMEHIENKETNGAGTAARLTGDGTQN